MTHLPSYFLTEPDPRAEVKGSRDPMGTQAMWTALGRTVVANLTTVTTSLRSFTTLLVGLDLAQRATEAGGHSKQDAFLVWEQLAGYARCCIDDETTNILGARRVLARTRQGQATLGAQGRSQILSNQRSYGLWGLYSSAARASGLVVEGRSTLTDAGEDIVRACRASADLTAREERDLMQLLQRDGVQITLKRSNSQLGLVASLTRAAPEAKAHFSNHLVRGGSADDEGDLQQELAELMLETETADARHLAKAADGRLAERLRRIIVAESALAPSLRLFAHLLSRHDMRLDVVAEGVRDAWGEQLPSVDERVGDVLDTRWSAVADALRGGDYESAIRLLITQNAETMQRRGGAPWIRLDERDRLEVAQREDSADLPRREEMPTLWINPYFLPSLHAVSKDVAAIV